MPCGLYWRSKNIPVSDIGDRKYMRSQLETKRFFSLRILRPTQILVSNLNSVETKVMFGFRFRDRNSNPVSIRDQEDFGLQGVREGSGQFRDRKSYWSQNKIRDQLFRFRNAICSETDLWIQSPIETNCMFGLEPQNHLQFRDSHLETKWKVWSPLETNKTFGLNGCGSKFKFGLCIWDRNSELVSIRDQFSVWTLFLETGYAFRSPIETKIDRSLTVGENQKHLSSNIKPQSNAPIFSSFALSSSCSLVSALSLTPHTSPSSFHSLTHSLPSSFKLLRRVLLLRRPGNSLRYGSHLCPPPRHD